MTRSKSAYVQAGKMICLRSIREAKQCMQDGLVWASCGHFFAPLEMVADSRLADRDALRRGMLQHMLPEFPRRRLVMGASHWLSVLPVVLLATAALTTLPKPAGAYVSESR